MDGSALESRVDYCCKESDYRLGWGVDGATSLPVPYRTVTKLTDGPHGTWHMASPLRQTATHRNVRID